MPACDRPRSPALVVMNAEIRPFSGRFRSFRPNDTQARFRFSTGVLAAVFSAVRVVL